MKLLTLNTHALLEENYPQKLRWFVDDLLQAQPDVIALQEVNQTAAAASIDPELLQGQFPLPGPVPIRRDNHAAQVALALHRAGVPCSWAWLPVKLGYGKYDEGVAIIALRREIRRADAFFVSRGRDYRDWRTRMVLGVQLQGMDDWFYSVHMGWWDDEQEPFADQWAALRRGMTGKRAGAPLWLMGDFNAPDTVRGESYDRVAADGWMDCHRAALHRDGGITVPGAIDGWRDNPAGYDTGGMRLDYIWCSRPRTILRAGVMFNGQNGPVVSDHYGVFIETKEC